MTGPSGRRAGVARRRTEVGGEYGIVRAAARERAHDALDKLIAGHARALGCVLVTNNERDFWSYAGLKIENWLERSAAGP